MMRWLGTDHLWPAREGVILHSIEPVALSHSWVLIFSRVANFNSQAGLLKLFLEKDIRYRHCFVRKAFPVGGCFPTSCRLLVCGYSCAQFLFSFTY